jgi:hypothetical protein
MTRRSRALGLVLIAAGAGIGVARAQTVDPWKKSPPSATDVVEPWSSASASAKPPASIAAPTDVVEPWAASSAAPKSSAGPISAAGDTVEPWPTSPIPDARRPLGAIAAVESVRFEPSQSAARTISIHGAFSLWLGATYSAPQPGYMYFECPVGKEAECHAQWKRIAEAVKASHCVGFGWDSPPGSIRASDEPRADPDGFLLLNGTHRVAAGQSVCLATHGALPHAAPSVSFDEAPTSDLPSSTELVRRSYAWQVLAVAYPSQILLLIGAVAASSGTKDGSSSGGGTALAFAGYTGWILGPPIVHWSHGHVARGFGSMALEFSLPVATAGIGGLIGMAVNPGDSNNSNGGLALGFVLGAVAAPLVDALFAVDEVPVESREGKIRVVPTVLASRGLAGLGLLGEF